MCMQEDREKEILCYLIERKKERKEEMQRHTTVNMMDYCEIIKMMIGDLKPRSLY